MLKITRRALLSALQGAKETHPAEFVCLLRGEEKGVDALLYEVIIPPLSHSDENSSSYSPWFIPAQMGELAGFHSHPAPNSAYPSKQDLIHFSQRKSIWIELNERHKAFKHHHIHSLIVKSFPKNLDPKFFYYSS